MAKVSIKIDGKTIHAAAEFAGVIFDIGRYFTERNFRPPQYPQINELNPYQVLGIDAQATNEEIKQRYKQLAIVWHPDKQGGNGEAMKRLNKAYDEICEQRRLDKKSST